MNYEKILFEIVSFATEKTKSIFDKFVSENRDIESIYGEFVINRQVPYIDVMSMIKENEKLPKDFKDRFIDYHKEFKKRQEKLRQDNTSIIAQIDKFSIINRYTNLSKEESYASFKAMKELIQKAVDTIRAKKFDVLIYGNIYLQNPKDPKAIATYNYTTDDITLKLFRNYPGHAFVSLIHELMHRIWHKLMTHEDKKKWENELNKKLIGTYKGNFPGFPSEYSKTEPVEYHAEVLTEYIKNNKKYSELIDEIL